MIQLLIWGLVPAVAIGFVSTLYLKYMRKHFPPAPDAALAAMTTDDRNRSYKRIDLPSRFAYLGVCVIVGWPLYKLLSAIAVWRYGLLPPAVLTYPVAGTFWILIAMLLAIWIGAFIVAAVMKRKWPDQYRFSISYLSNKYQTDYVRMSRHLFIVTCAITLALWLLGMNYYVQVREDGLVVKRMFALTADVYAFDEIKNIVSSPGFLAPNGKVRHERTAVILMKDGRRWASRDLPSGGQRDQLAILAELTKRSSAQTTEIQLFENDDVYIDK